MSLSNNAENLLLNLIFRNSGVPNLGDSTGLVPSTANGSLYISLHTADPGEAGAQNTTEVNYTGYDRVAVTRPTGWTVTTSGIFNAGAITFPIATGGSSTAYSFGIGTNASGVGTLLFSADFNSSLVITSGITPRIAASGLNIIAN